MRHLAIRESRRPVRAVRDPRQRFDEAAEFVWRRRMGEARPGDPVDKSTIRKGRLRVLWRAGWIELAGWQPNSRRRTERAPRPAPHRTETLRAESASPGRDAGQGGVPAPSTA